MTKVIGLKQLQQNTKMVRQGVAKGVKFIVVYRSQPIFEITPIDEKYTFAEEMKETGLYKSSFIEKMKNAEDELNKGNFEEYTS